MRFFLYRVLLFIMILIISDATVTAISTDLSDYLVTLDRSQLKEASVDAVVKGLCSPGMSRHSFLSFRRSGVLDFGASARTRIDYTISNYTVNDKLFYSQGCD